MSSTEDIIKQLEDNIDNLKKEIVAKNNKISLLTDENEKLRMEKQDLENDIEILKEELKKEHEKRHKELNKINDSSNEELVDFLYCNRENIYNTNNISKDDIKEQLSRKTPFQIETFNLLARIANIRNDMCDVANKVYKELESEKFRNSLNKTMIDDYIKSENMQSICYMELFHCCLLALKYIPEKYDSWTNTCADNTYGYIMYKLYQTYNNIKPVLLDYMTNNKLIKDNDHGFYDIMDKYSTMYMCYKDSRLQYDCFKTIIKDIIKRAPYFDDEHKLFKLVYPPDYIMDVSIIFDTCEYKDTDDYIEDENEEDDKQ